MIVNQEIWRHALIHIHFFNDRKNKLYNGTSLEAGPKARRVACHVAGVRSLSRGQMFQLPMVPTFFDTMEKVILEQG